MRVQVPPTAPRYKDLQITVGPFCYRLKSCACIWEREMNKKYFVLMMLSLALYSQSSFAAEVVDSQNQNISIEQKIIQS